MKSAWPQHSVTLGLVLAISVNTATPFMPKPRCNSLRYMSCSYFRQMCDICLVWLCETLEFIEKCQTWRSAAASRQKINKSSITPNYLKRREKRFRWFFGCFISHLAVIWGSNLSEEGPAPGYLSVFFFLFFFREMFHDKWKNIEPTFFHTSDHWMSFTKKTPRERRVL